MFTWYYVYTHNRIITSIRGSSTEYGVEESKLKPFEKLLQNLEGKLMEGQIFKVSLLDFISTV